MALGTTTEVIAVTLAVAEALLEGNDVVTARYGVSVAERYLDVPDILPDVRDALSAGTPPEWFSHLIVHRERLTVVGFGGFKGPPVDGEVEVGYSIAPAHRRRGHASAALARFVALARRRRVQVVSAHTLAEESASARLLRRTGFTTTAVVVDEELGALWRWELRLDG